MEYSGNIKSLDSVNLNHGQNHGYSRVVDLRDCYPFVKWAGGKSQLLSELDSMIPTKFNRYFEPFLGGGAMFFHLISDRNTRFSTYLSDINEELITAYKVVKNNVSELIQILKRHRTEYNRNPSKYYYKLRDEIKPRTEIDRTARFIALNKTCFNGLYRVNRSGIFNVPMGRYKNPLICDASNLENISKAFRYSKAATLPVIQILGLVTMIN
jgi:DNA adenine methylase